MVIRDDDELGFLAGTLTFGMTIMHNPPHPGEVIKNEILASLELSVPKSAEQLGIPHDTLSMLVRRKSSMDANTASALETAGYGSARSWMKMQENRDLWDQNNPEISLSSSP